MRLRRRRRDVRQEEVVVSDPYGFVARHFGFDDWSPQHELRVKISGSEQARRDFAANLRAIAAGEASTERSRG